MRKKGVLSFFLAIIMSVSLIPSTVFAQKGRSYSTPSRSSPSPARSYSTPKQAAPAAAPKASPPPARIYTTPKAAPTPVPAPSKSFTTPKTSPATAPTSPTVRPNFQSNIGSDAAKAQRQEESRKSFSQANQPKYDARDRQIRDLGSQLSQERMANRELRKQSTFGTYYSRPSPAVVYHDNFNPYFWLWLMDRPQYDRDRWVYNHRDEIDSSRLQELKTKDADLDRRLAELEKSGAAKDPSYVPQGVDKDLMYSDDSVKQAYTEAHSSFPWGTLLVIFLVCGGLIFLTFFKRWKVG